MTKEDFASGKIETLFRSYGSLNPRFDITVLQDSGFYDYTFRTEVTGISVCFVENLDSPLQPPVAYPFPTRYKNMAVIEVISFPSQEIEDYSLTIPTAELSLPNLTACLDLLTANRFSNLTPFSCDLFRTQLTSLGMPFSYERL